MLTKTQFNGISWRSTQRNSLRTFSHYITGIISLCKTATIPILNLWSSPQNGFQVSIPPSPVSPPEFIFPNNNLIQMRKQGTCPFHLSKVNFRKKNVLIELHFIFGQLLCHTVQQLALHEITHGKIST